MKVTLASLRTQARQRCDQVNSQFCSDSEVNQYINNSATELYDLLVATYEDNYIQGASFFTTNGNDTYLLPDGVATFQSSAVGGGSPFVAPAFYKLIGLDLIQGNGKPLSLKKFMFNERNNFAYLTSWNYLNFVAIRYRLLGSNVKFVPVPDAAYQLVLWYVPQLPKLVTDSDTIDGVSGWEEYIVIDVAIKMAQKEETDVSVLLAQKDALKARIQSMAANRDAGSPERISDVDEQDFDPFFRRLP